MTRQRLHIAISRIHKLLGLLIGLQLLLWVAGGFIMSFLEIENVRGEHLRVDLPQAILKQPARFPIQNLPDWGTIVGVNYEEFYKVPVYRITRHEGQTRLYHAHTGAPLSPLSKEWIKRIATENFNGSAPIKTIELLSSAAPDFEYRGSFPIWQVSFNTPDNLNVYISPQTGQVLSWRTDTWRLFDFVWMLHIMDYEARDNFNNPLLLAFSFSAVLFLLTGFFMLWFRLSKRDFKL
ncbi:PepSY domain-containing protein [Temperatibacter marinus]|uniref:PepSY domain-containing protein n=1 Tax=Temperatibacter marinus TaxID=1456591 RepID=A0AA52EF08_9PROT|nr:PepSY domain-containing protein [Temperatibacter marinus]WND01615.1 PepSY domain-containing protein [Temperatibacter marinus]